MNDPFDLVSFETNELLNLQDMDFQSLISEINLSDAPGKPINGEYRYSLAANYDPKQYDIYIQNTFKNTNQMNSKYSSKYKRILPSCVALTNKKTCTSDKRADYVRYGRGLIKKNSDAIQIP